MKICILFFVLGFGLISAKEDHHSSSVDISPLEVENGKLLGDTSNQEPPVLHFAVKENNVTCILAQFSAIEGYDGSLSLFHFDGSNTSVVLSSIQITLPNNITYQSYNKTLYTVPVGNSYKCDAGFDVDLSDEKHETISLSLRSIRFDAFRKSENEDFETNSICSGDAKSNKTVPMIIAFVLGGMVVIMLVGYIILRRREDKSVYQSV
uniref:Lysosome-associated membrane glycoprotein 1 n=1 Tax=Tetranychus urticae TaxID=32264 RepID=T1KIP9_TETUR